MHGGFSREVLPTPWNVIYYAIIRYITHEYQYQVLYYYHFPIPNHFRNLDHISFLFLFLQSMEDCIYKAKRKQEEGKNFYLIHQGLMNKLYIHHLAQNSSLLVNSLAFVTHQVSLDPGLSPSHKKVKKAPSLEVKISLI